MDQVNVAVSVESKLPRKPIRLFLALFFPGDIKLREAADDQS